MPKRKSVEQRATANLLRMFPDGPQNREQRVARDWFLFGYKRAVAAERRRKRHA